MSEKTEFALTYEDLSLTVVRNGEHSRILGPITGCTKSGQVCCIIGLDQQCSDLFDALRGNFQLLSTAGYSQDGKFISGTITWNGQLPNLVDPRVIARVDRHFDRMSAAHLSAWEILLVTVKIRVPNLTQEEQASMVDMILDMMSLQEKSSLPVNHLDPLSLVMLNIGRELIGCSGILLLQNPLNSLLPDDARAVLSRLSLLAEKHSYCVTFTVSRPVSGIFSYLSDITVLSCSGTVLFHGPGTFAKQVFSYHGFDCPEDYSYLDFLLHHVCHLADASVDAMVIFSADSDFSKASRRAAADIRSRKVNMPMLIERRGNYNDSESRDLRWFASMLRFEWSLIYNDPNSISKFLLFPLVLGTVVGCIFFGLPRDSVGAQERAGFFFLLLSLFCLDAVHERAVMRTRILWNDCCSHRLNISAFVVSCLFGELFIRRGVPVLIMITGCYIFMGLAEDFALYLEFTALTVVGCWIIFIIPLAFDLIVFSCERGRGGLQPAGGEGLWSLGAWFSLVGLLALGLGLLTMGFPLTGRDVPGPLGWVSSCLPMQSVFSAMMNNQVGSFPDGDTILKKSGFVAHGNLFFLAALSIGYLIIAVYVFLLQHPEPESGPSARLLAYVLEGCLQSVEKGIACLRRMGDKSAPTAVRGI